MIPSGAMDTSGNVTGILKHLRSAPILGNVIRSRTDLNIDNRSLDLSISMELTVARGYISSRLCNCIPCSLSSH